MSTSSYLSPEKAHALILKSFEGRDKAYTPYSKFNVGAAILFDGDVTITGCNVENASYGACICAERTAMTKAVSEGYTKPRAVAVTSLLKTPDISPCGICRQFLREFAPLDTPVYMIADGYPRNEELPTFWKKGQETEAEFKKLVTIMTLEELLPMSFGPEHLSR